MEVKEFFKMSQKIYNELQPLNSKDSKLIIDILNKNSIEYGKIRTFSVENSQKIVLLTLKQNCLILIKYLLENEVIIENSILEAIVPLLDIVEDTDSKTFDLYVQIEIERILEGISNLIVDIVFLSKFKNQKLIKFIESKKIPNSLSVNLVLFFDEEISLESFELSVLNQRAMGPVFLSLIKSYKNSLRSLAKTKLLEHLKPLLKEGSDNHYIFEAFYLLNTEKHMDLLNVKPDGSEEYFAFISSLVVDKETADIVYFKLEEYFEDFETALKTLININISNSQIRPKDEKMILYLLECIKKIMRFKGMYFYKFLGLFQRVLRLKIRREIKGLIYDILCKYLTEKDIYIERVVDCRQEIEEEIKSKDFFLLPRVIKFQNAYSRRERKEVELMNKTGNGSPYVPNGENFSKIADEYKILGLVSEDPSAVMECLDSYIQPEIIKMHSSNIRSALIKDTRIIERLIQFQIENKFVIEDISIINLIMCHSSGLFFEYASLFKNFSFYLNGDFLERLNDSLEEGITWINDHYTKEIGVFILKNCVFFNEIVMSRPEIQSKISFVYEKILDENLDDVTFTVDHNMCKDDVIDTLFLSDEMVDEGFFRIFAKILLFEKFYKNSNDIEPLKRKYNSKFFEIYVKAKVVCGLSVETDVEFLIKNLLASDDLLGYLKICGCFADEKAMIGLNIIRNFGVKDSNYVLKNFENSSIFERFVLFFSVDDVGKEMDSLIKNQVMVSMKDSNKVYVRMCILQLFKCRDLDYILKILEKNYDDKLLLFKLNLHNISTGGSYFSKSIFEHGTDDLKGKALLLIYYQNVWEKIYLLNILERMDCNLSEDLKYLRNNIE